MQLLKLNRTNPEQVFISCYNNTGANTRVGDPAFFDYTNTGSKDGIACVLTCATTNVGSFAGVWTQVVAAGNYGRVQCYGHCGTIITRAQDTAIAPGSPLGVEVGMTCFESWLGGTYDINAWNVIAASTIATANSTTTYAQPGFIRAL